jgi:hypothetical protein
LVAAKEAWYFVRNRCGDHLNDDGLSLKKPSNQCSIQLMKKYMNELWWKMLAAFHLVYKPVAIVLVGLAVMWGGRTLLIRLLSTGDVPEAFVAIQGAIITALVPALNVLTGLVIVMLLYYATRLYLQEKKCCRCHFCS